MAVSTAEAPGAMLLPELSELLTELRASLAAIPLQAYASQTPRQARHTAARLRELRSMIDTHIGAAVRAVERLVPGRDTRQLLAADFGLDTAAAHRDVKNAHTAATASRAEEQAAHGVISHAHAVVIGRALRDLPVTTTAPQRQHAEQTLIEDARRLAPKELETRARRVSELFQPDDEVDAAEDSLLRRREAAAFSKASLTMWDNRDGTWSGKFVLPELAARMFKTIIDAHAAPRRSNLAHSPVPSSQLQEAHRSRSDEHAGGAAQPIQGGNARSGEGRSGAVGSGDSHARSVEFHHGRPSRVQQARIDAENDKPYDRKAGRALMALIEHLPVDKLPTTGGTPARVMVTINESKLRSAVAAATLSTGERLSAGELRRLACNHGILPAVLGGASIPVDLGRTQRLFSTHQRDALAALDGGCIAPGCDRPPAWCEAHHGADPWNSGGRTDLKDGYLLCCSHHHEAHQDRWKLRRQPDGHAEINRGSGWERNHRYRP